MSAGEIIRNRAIAQSRQELMTLAKSCDNLWRLEAALMVLQGLASVVTESKDEGGLQ